MNPKKTTNEPTKEDKLKSKSNPVSEDSASSSSIPNNGELAEMIDLLKRTQANFENYRKQMEKRILEIQQFAAQAIILQILPIVDNLELALKNLKNINAIDAVNTNAVNAVSTEESQKKSDFALGIELIYAQLSQVLEQNGVQAILTQQQKFDPYYHEALLKVESDLPENVIVEEFQKGFTMYGKVLRLAKVKVSSGKKISNQISSEKNNDQK